MNVSWCPKNTRLNANDTKVIAKIDMIMVFYE